MCGGQTHRLINICRKKMIYLWQTTYTSEGMVFYILAPDYSDVCRIAGQCGGTLTVKEKRGLPYFIRKNKKHSGFAAGLVLAALCIYIMSLYIWNIEITGNSYYSEETICQFLDDAGAGCGARKGRLVPSEIEEELRIHYPFISWVSVQITGTKLLIAMEEGVLPKEEQTGETTSASGKDITAVSDGVVVSIVTRKGTPLVHAGDEVSAGDVLIRSTVDIIGDDQSVVQTLETGADGDIILRMNYPVEKSADRTYKIRDYTGNTHQSLQLSVFNHSLYLGEQDKVYENSDMISETRKFRLTSNFYLPFVLTRTTESEYQWKTMKYTDSELKQILTDYVCAVQENIESLNGKIIENHVEYQIGASGGKAAGYMVVEVYNLNR